MSVGKNVKPRCFFDIQVGDEQVGRVVFELLNDVCPLTCENFRCLCTGEMGIGKSTQKPLHYKGVPVHRVVKNFMIQGGDFSMGNGRGGESIYGGTFKDENFELKHEKPYLLSMANRGKDTNGSQFFITTKPAPHLDGVHVVFGHVISGQEVVASIENQPTDEKSRPLKDVVIANCGELIPQIKLKDKKKKRSKSESENKEAEGKKSRHKKSKKHKKHKHHSKEKTEKSEKVDAVEEDKVECSVKPEEVPKIPENKLMRPLRVYEKEDEASSDRKDARNPRRRNPTTIIHSRSGRKIKGRGFRRYRTPSPGGFDRGRSETPPHWRFAQAKVKTLDEVLNPVDKTDFEKRDRSDAKHGDERNRPRERDAYERHRQGYNYSPRGGQRDRDRDQDRDRDRDRERDRFADRNQRNQRDDRFDNERNSRRDRGRDGENRRKFIENPSNKSGEKGRRDDDKRESAPEKQTKKKEEQAVDEDKAKEVVDETEISPPRAPVIEVVSYPIHLTLSSEMSSNGSSANKGLIEPEKEVDKENHPKDKKEASQPVSEINRKEVSSNRSNKALESHETKENEKEVTVDGSKEHRDGRKRKPSPADHKSEVEVKKKKDEQKQGKDKGSRRRTNSGSSASSASSSNSSSSSSSSGSSSSSSSPSPSRPRSSRKSRS